MPISERELAERILCTLIGEGISQIYDYYEIFEFYNNIHVGESLLEDLQKLGLSLNQLLQKFPKNFIYFGNGRWQGVYVGNSSETTHSPPASILLSYWEVKRALQRKTPIPTVEEVCEKWGFSCARVESKEYKKDEISIEEMEKGEALSAKVHKFLKHFERPKPPMHPPLSPLAVEKLFKSSAET
ncbi:hypothetical protein CAEBREN_03802 [Caenorhabditis brenneri]|uniref:Uncharacterized protein n=1 Tax=Caenorhabditis brenneri TaxID=135651 RepID=G0MH99_CAEBE|nr:hypothetical protein CAEBREN_03802 [Caenorhabditis brenneri]